MMVTMNFFSNLALPTGRNHTGNENTLATYLTYILFSRMPKIGLEDPGTYLSHTIEESIHPRVDFSKKMGRAFLRGCGTML